MGGRRRGLWKLGITKDIERCHIANNMSRRKRQRGKVGNSLKEKSLKEKLPEAVLRSKRPSPLTLQHKDEYWVQGIFNETLELGDQQQWGRPQGEKKGGGLRP